MGLNTLNIGVIGYGYWGPNLVRNLVELSGCRLKYICDFSAKNLEKAAKRYPSVITTDQHGRLFADEEIDAVIIATPVASHYGLAKQALEAGKHVFVEKPLAASVEQAAQLVWLSRHLKKILMVGHTFEYSAAVIKIKKLIDSGELGRVHYITSSRINLGIHQPDVSVIWDLATHDFSILFYWLGEEARQVAAFGRDCVAPGRPDVAFVNLRFPSGVVAEIQLSWLSPVKLRRTMVVGDRKMLLYDDTANSETIKIYDHGVQFIEPDTFGEFQLSYRTGDVFSPKIDVHEPLALEMEHFLDCARHGSCPKTDGLNGLRVVRALEAAEMSLNGDGQFILLNTQSEGRAAQSENPRMGQKDGTAA